MVNGVETCVDDRVVMCNARTVIGRLNVNPARCIARDQDGKTCLIERTARRLDIFAHSLAFRAAFWDCGAMVVVVFVMLINLIGWKRKEHEYVCIIECASRSQDDHARPWLCQSMTLPAAQRVVH